MKYKHNDYYGYINKIQEQAIKNPQWFWSNDSKATEARQWLYNNGASKIVDEIYENTPDSVKKNIDSKKLSKHISDNIKTGQIKKDIYDRQKKFLDTAVAIGATTLPLIAVAPTVVTSPGTIVGGLVGGALGAEGTNAAVRKLSNGKYSNWGDFASKGKYHGETLNTLIDFTNPGAIIVGGLGTKAGHSLYSNLSNRYTFNQLLKNGKLEYVGPTQYTGYHQSDKVIPQFKFPYKRWDVKNHKADPNGAFFSEKPVTEGFLSKRPVINKYNISSNKSLIQHGDITLGIGQGKNNLRNYIVKQARKNGADVVKFENIADNTLFGQNVLFATDKSKITLKDIDLSPKYNGPSLEEHPMIGYRIPGGDFSTRPINQIPKGDVYMYRVVGKPAIIDLLNTNKIRSKTGIHSASQSWITEHFPEFVSKYPDFASWDKDKVSNILKTEFGWKPGLIENFNIRNSTNHGGTIGYYEDITYPSYWYDVRDTHLPIIATPKNGVNKFKYGHHGHIYPDDEGGPTVLVDSFGNNKNVVGDASDSKIFLWNNGKYMEVPR